MTGKDDQERLHNLNLCFLLRRIHKNGLKHFLFYYITLCFLMDSVTASDDLIIKTNKGKVMGETMSTPNGKKVDVYYGIPYAKPPLDNLRFKHPLPIDAWDGIYNATKKPNACVQIIDTFFGPDFAGSKIWNVNTERSEDCLYLNIWVPKPRPKPGSMSVLVWIYGGSFLSGSSSLDVYDSEYLASEENVIVASLNYRVASLGFLHVAGRSDAPGNAGLYDQAMALQFIRENIEFFGGNASSITIFGESSGSASCSLHLLSPLSQGYFKNVILQSGSALSPWAVTEKNVIHKRAKKLAKVVKCPADEENLDDMMNCLRKTDPLKLVENEYSVENFGVVDFPFTPIVDGHFLPDHPINLLKEGNFKKTNMLAGSNTEEGTFFIMYYLPQLFKFEEGVTVARQEFLKAVKQLFPRMNKLATDAIIFQYTNWANPNDEMSNRDMIDKMIGDYNFNCPVNDFSSYYAENGQNLYLYYYQHRYSSQPYPRWTGVLHGDEIPIVFGEPLKPHKSFTSSEVKFSKMIMKYWANFAKTGNPNTGMQQEQNSIDLPDWKISTPENHEYIVLQENSHMADRGPRLQECAFWREYVTKLVKYTISTINAAPTANSSNSTGFPSGIIEEGPLCLRATEISQDASRKGNASTVVPTAVINFLSIFFIIISYGIFYGGKWYNL